MRSGPGARRPATRSCSRIRERDRRRIAFRDRIEARDDADCAQPVPDRGAGRPARLPPSAHRVAPGADGTRAADAVRIPLLDMLASRVRFVQTEISDPDLPGRRLLTDTLHLEPGRHHGHGGGHPEAGVLAAKRDLEPVAGLARTRTGG